MAKTHHEKVEKQGETHHCQFGQQAKSQPEKLEKTNNENSSFNLKFNTQVKLKGLPSILGKFTTKSPHN